TIYGGVSSPCGTAPASSQPIAVLTSQYRPAQDPPQYGVTNAFTGGGTQAFIPGLYNNYYSNISSLIVQNAGSAPTTVTVQYTGGTGTATDIVSNLAVGASKVFYTPNAGTCSGCSGHLPSGWQGSAIVSSDGQNILAQVNKA